MVVRNKAIQNAGWIIGVKVVQAALGIIISMLTARYLGPSNYGLINYASSLVAFVAPIGKLGFDSILVNEFIRHPDREGETLGTSIVMSLASSVVCMVGLAAFVAVANPGEPVTLIVCVLYSVVLLANAAELTHFWFQAHLLSKYTSLAALVAYVVKSTYQIILLVKGSSIYWFSIVNALDIFLIAVIILVQYKQKKGQRLRFSWEIARSMLAQSRYYIVSSMMVTIFANTDRIMLKLMLGDVATGYYSAAVACASLTSFVFTAIISSVRPVVLDENGKDTVKFDKTLTILYSVIIYLSLLQCIGITAFAQVIIRVLYGVAYTPAITPLRWIVWYTTFSYLGAVRDIWILAKKKQYVLWKINLSGAVVNVVLNCCLIPVWGITGAAVASLLTQIYTNVIQCFFIKEIQPTLVYLKNASNPRYVYQMFKQVIVR